MTTLETRAPTTSGLEVRIGSLLLRNPIMPASGCFGPELGALVACDRLGATVTKTVFAGARGGNPVHRLTEIEAGMVNSVGIPSRGPAGYLATLHPRYQALGAPVIVSVGGHRESEYAPIVKEIGQHADAFELNVSCPNLDADGRDIGSDPTAIASVVRESRAVTDLPLIIKLPPMVASIADCARAAEDAGADAVCVSNSIPVLPIEAGRRSPALGNIVGGLTGPSIKPIVTRLVWQASRRISIPVIACGGISTADDVLDYLSVGAAAAQVGTATFARPMAMLDIVDDLEARVAAAAVPRLSDLLEVQR